MKHPLLRLKLFLTLLALTLLTALAAPVQAQNSAPRAERLAFAAYRNGQWDIYSLAADGSDSRQLTEDPYEDTDPAYSPDGTKIAYASRRDHNWDVYVLDLRTGQETRLTRSPHYDGAPTWNPEGTGLAYESYQNGNLDIWQVDLTGQKSPVNLTADSPDGDFAPAWSPDGRAIAFTSWRHSHKDVLLLNLANGAVTRLTHSDTAEEGPVWSPDGDRLAVISDNLGDREVFTLKMARPAEVLEVSLESGAPPLQPLTWLGRTDGPAWSSDGQSIAAIFHRWNGDIITLTRLNAGYQLPRQLTGPLTLQGRLTWQPQAVNFGYKVAALTDAGPSPLYEEQLTPNDTGEPYDMVRLNDVDTGTPWLADTVDDSFRAWRSRLRDEVGYDFLSQLSDASRDVGQYSETTQYASWHKSGRAVDTLFDYHLNEKLAHEIVREDYSGNTYWRVFLRCEDQSGRCGRPLTANPWDYSDRARTEIAPEQGGIEKANLSGYYVDFSTLAHEYGWERISSYDDEDYSWTWHFLAFENWHYQKRLTNGSGLSRQANWYQAMSEVYPGKTLAEYFTWQKMRQVGDNPHLIALKGVPLPLEAKPWWAMVEQAR